MVSTYLTVLVAAFVVYLLRWRRKVRDLPPGPTRLPVIGSVLSMPAKLDSEKFSELGRVYSEYLSWAWLPKY
jgi:hypothetical protein